MVQNFKTKIVPISRIQVSPARLRRKNVAAAREAMHLIRKYGQPRPLIVGPDYQLLSDTVSYLALKAARHDLAKVFQVSDTSPAVVHAVGRLLICAEIINRQAECFNAALASLNQSAELDVEELVRELLPVIIAGTGELLDRGSSSVASDADDRTLLKI
ncbi:MAG: hypothetical protein NVV83_01490 [Afipia sp.]|nr:hypothetical protein [Afipia sp.]